MQDRTEYNASFFHFLDGRYKIETDKCVYYVLYVLNNSARVLSGGYIISECAVQECEFGRLIIIEGEKHLLPKGL